MPQSGESSCLGAAVLGRYAIGEINDLSEVKNMVNTQKITKPDTDNASIYKELIPIYSRLSELFEQEYNSLSEFQDKFK